MCLTVLQAQLCPGNVVQTELMQHNNYSYLYKENNISVKVDAPGLPARHEQCPTPNELK